MYVLRYLSHVLDMCKIVDSFTKYDDNEDVEIRPLLESCLS